MRKVFILKNNSAQQIYNSSAVRYHRSESRCICTLFWTLVVLPLRIRKNWSRINQLCRKTVL